MIELSKNNSTKNNLILLSTITNMSKENSVIIKLNNVFINTLIFQIIEFYVSLYQDHFDTKNGYYVLLFSKEEILDFIKNYKNENYYCIIMIIFSLIKLIKFKDIKLIIKDIKQNINIIFKYILNNLPNIIKKLTNIIINQQSQTLDNLEMLIKLLLLMKRLKWIITYIITLPKNEIDIIIDQNIFLFDCLFRDLLLINYIKVEILNLKISTYITFEDYINLNDYTPSELKNEKISLEFKEYIKDKENMTINSLNDILQYSPNTFSQIFGLMFQNYHNENNKSKYYNYLKTKLNNYIKQNKPDILKYLDNIFNKLQNIFNEENKNLTEEEKFKLSKYFTEDDILKLSKLLEELYLPKDKQQQLESYCENYNQNDQYTIPLKPDTIKKIKKILFIVDIERELINKSIQDELKSLK